MYDQILFPTDGSEPADIVFDYALQIASEHEATIHILNVADTSQDSFVRIRGDVIDVLEPEGEEIVKIPFVDVYDSYPLRWSSDSSGTPRRRLPASKKLEPESE